MAKDGDHPTTDTITPSDIQARDVKRRAFLRRAGGVAGGMALFPLLKGCGGTDSCDSDTGDPIVVDEDPTDPAIVDADTGDDCDSDGL